jgi:2,4-dienoyl-CoA reductase-like NADH-dependent reductase (Old Yellow Enzyme family)
VSVLFSPLQIRSATLRNRIAVSPMCQYSATDGLPNDWHLVHLGSRAVGGAGLVIAEKTGVEPRGRITPQDTGIWSGAHVDAWRPITAFLREHGAVPAVQLGHAGFKASSYRPFEPGRSGGVPNEEGGWTPVGPGSEPFVPEYRTPEPLTEDGIRRVVSAFGEGAERAVDAGFAAVEVHAAHGYLLHQFYSPLTNHRTDAYGGSLENRMRLAVEVTAAVREAVGEDVPVLVRISATDWVEGGWTVDDSVELATRLAENGADLIDCSSGGVTPGARIPIGPGYQVPLAEAVRRKAEVPTGAVGIITDPLQAEQVLTDGAADLVLLGRELLRDPYWPLHAAAQLGAEAPIPVQYARAF